AVVATVMTVTPAIVPHRQPWWLTALAALMSVPVLSRRRALLTAGAGVGSATTFLAIAAKSLPHSLMLPLASRRPSWSLPVAVARCACAVRELAPRSRPVGHAAVGVGMAVSLILPHEDLETYRYLVTAIVAAYAVGVGARARRAARNAEREGERRLREERVAA